MRNHALPRRAHTSTTLVLLALLLGASCGFSMDLTIHWHGAVGDTGAGYGQDSVVYPAANVQIQVGSNIPNGTYAFWYRATRSWDASYHADDYFPVTVSNGVGTITDGWTHLGGTLVQLGEAYAGNAVTYTALRFDVVNVGDSGFSTSVSGDTVLTRRESAANDPATGTQFQGHLVLQVGNAPTVTTKFQLDWLSHCLEGGTAKLYVDGVLVGTTTIDAGSNAQATSGAPVINVTQTTGHTGTYHWTVVNPLTGEEQVINADTAYTAISTGWDGMGVALGTNNVTQFTLECPMNSGTTSTTGTGGSSPDPYAGTGGTPPTIGPPKTPDTPGTPHITVNGGGSGTGTDVIVDNTDDFYAPFKKALDDANNENYSWFNPQPLFDPQRHAIDDSDSKTKEDGLRSAWSNLTGLGSSMKGRMDTLKQAFQDAYDRGRQIQIAQQNPGMAYLFLIQVHGHTYPVDLSPYASVISWLRKLQVFIVTVVFWKMTLQILGSPFFPE
jgi:hypothetical protein